MFWQVVYELGSYKEVDAMTIDEFLEAHAALTVINEDVKKEIEEGGD